MLRKCLSSQVLTSVCVLFPVIVLGPLFSLLESSLSPPFASESSCGETAHTDQMDPVTKVKEWGPVTLVCVHAQAHRIPHFASVYETLGGPRASAPISHGALGL